MTEQKTDREIAEYRISLARMMGRDPEVQYTGLAGMKLELIYEDETSATFEAGRFDPEVEDGTYSEGVKDVMGEVLSASGHHFHAVIHLCVDDSCEHYGSTIFALDGKGSWETYQQGTEEFDVWVKEMEANVDAFEMFPYRYRYLDASLRDDDHHVGNDGWSLR